VQISFKILKYDLTTLLAFGIKDVIIIKPFYRGSLQVTSQIEKMQAAVERNDTSWAQIANRFMLNLKEELARGNNAARSDKESERA